MKRQEKVLQLLRSDVAMEEHMKEIEDEITGIKRIIRGSGTE
jgi:CRISPR/Cas system-associated protein Cas5 (RAMP superfamily)